MKYERIVKMTGDVAREGGDPRGSDAGALRGVLQCGDRGNSFGKENDMIEQWIREIKERANFEDLGMFLAHHGVVRATSKDGRRIREMRLAYDRRKLADLVREMEGREGIVAVRVWINEGLLRIGDGIMYALVAGKFRTTVFPVLEELVSRIKREIVEEKEYF